MTLNKTLSIRERTVNIYLPTIEAKARWAKTAKARKRSLSGFIVETIESALASEEREEGESQAKLVSRVKELGEQVATLSKDLQRYRSLIDLQERELRDLRAGPFIDPNFMGGKLYPKALIELLRERGNIRYEDIHSLLGIDPGTDASAALQSQLNALEQYGIIDYSNRHIRWKL
jgi:hypothetical protein